MQRLVIALISCAFGFGALAQEAPKSLTDPAPSSQQQSDVNRDKISTQQNGATPPPIIVNVYPAPRSEAETQKEERERKEKADLDRRLVELTGDLAKYTEWLAYATALLFLVTTGLFYLAIRQARDAKDAGLAARDSAAAAKLSADASIRANLPRIRVGNFRMATGSGTVPAQGVLADHPSIKLQVGNLGQSLAEITGLCIKVKVSIDPPSQPDYDDPWKFGPTELLLGAVPHQTEKLFEWGDGDLDGLRAFTHKIWIYGYVTYLDFMGDEHEVRYCGLGQPIHQGSTLAPVVFLPWRNAGEEFTRHTYIKRSS